MLKKKQVVEFTQSNVMLVLKLYFYKSKYKAYCTKNATTFTLTSLRLFSFLSVFYNRRIPEI